MYKLIGIFVIILGIISALLFYTAAVKFANTGEDLSNLRSVSGTSIAEAYYQEIGHYGIANSSLCYGLAFMTLCLSISMGVILISKDSDSEIDDS